MPTSNHRGIPLLRGVVESVGPWGAQFSQANLRVYPYHRGTYANGSSTSTTVPVRGYGEFRVNDYLMVCSRTAYGLSYLYIPQTSKVSRVTALSSSTDELTLSTALTIEDGDFLLNLGADGAVAPLTAPNLDGSRIELYADPVGSQLLGADYTLTGSLGQFSTWLSLNAMTIDLLVTSDAGVPLLLIPGVAVVPADPAGFHSIASATVTTTAETSLVAAGFGSTTLPAHTFEVGSTLRVRARGIYTTTGTPGNITATFYLDSTAIVASAAAALPASQTNATWSLDLDLTCRSVGAGGTAIASGLLRLATATPTTNALIGLSNTAPVALDTTDPKVVDLKMTLSASGQSVTCTLFELEILK